MNKKELLNIIKTALMTLLYLVIICVAVVLITKENTELNTPKDIGEQDIKDGKFAEALSYYQELSYSYPDDYTLYLKMGKVYEKLNEPHEAKIEYYKAIKKAPYGTYSPYFALADVYVQQGDYSMAEEFISQIEDKPIKSLIKKKAEFYEKLGDKLAKNYDFTDAVLKYNQAYKYYLKFSQQKAQAAKEKAANAYTDQADYFMKTKAPVNAIQALKNAISAHANAVSYYKMGLIYRSQGQAETAAEFFESAYNINPSIINANIYYNLLIDLSEKYERLGNGMQSKLYEFRAKKIKKLMPVDFDVLIYVDSVEYSQNQKNKQIIPGINLRIRNNSDKVIDYLSLKVNFKENNKVVTSVESPVILKQNPLKEDEVTDEISLYAQTDSKKISPKSKYSIDIYISQKDPDEWFLYRTEDINNN